MSGPTEPRQYDVLFEVTGAGTLALDPRWHLCGSKSGMNVSVSWGQFGYAGGVIGYDELVRLRDFLDLWIAEHPKAEGEEMYDRFIRKIVRPDEPVIAVDPPASFV